MKKLKFNIRKGFTLVECIIAIAVFAIMTSMVLMIMASTVKLSKKASESESGLNQLVENVVQDSSNKAYGLDSKTLNMKFSGAYSADFAMSYSTVDGARNMFRCPSCNYEANSMDFMGYLYSHADYTAATDDEKKRFKISHWFNPSVSGKDKYVCPDCGASTNVASVNLECISCEKSGAATSFVYDSINGGYSCPDCGSGKVVQLDSTTNLPINQDQVNTNYDFKISSIQSNAIRYSDIEEPDEDARKKELIKLTSPSADGFNFNLAYTPSTVPQAVGVYTLTISGFTNLNDGDNSTVYIKLPPNYVCTVLPSSNVDTDDNDVSGTDVRAKWTGPAGDEYANNAARTELKIDNIQHNQNYIIKFTLTNYKNNQSFEDDYDVEGGLMKYWYGSSGSAINYTVPPPDPEEP